MDLAARKYNFIQKLLKVDESLLEKLENIIKINDENQDWFLELSAEEQSEIKIGLKEADNSEFVSHESIMGKFAKWH